METISGTIKWYDADKGYGFVTIPATADSPARDALLLSSVLRAYGASTVGKDSEVVIEIKKGARGLAVGKIVSMKMVEVNDGFVTARVKWYNADKGYGFVVCPGSDADNFVHAEIVKKAGLAGLIPDQDIQVRIIKGTKGTKVVEVKGCAVNGPVGS